MDNSNDVLHKRLKYVISFFVVCIIAIIVSIDSYQLYSSVRINEIRNRFLSADENNTDLVTIQSL